MLYPQLLGDPVVNTDEKNVIYFREAPTHDLLIKGWLIGSFLIWKII